MTPPPPGLPSAAGSRRQEIEAASAICQISPTRCQARTRLYRDGKLELEGFPVADISEYLADESVTIWLDLRGPDQEDLAVLSQEFGLHPRAVHAREQRVAGDAVARAVAARHVEAAAGGVDRQVLPEVCELQRRADRVRLGEALGLADAVQMQQQATDRLQMMMYNNVPIVLLYYGGSWGLFSTKHFTGWPSASNPYTLPTNYNYSLLTVVTHLVKA